jgi:hypothetical protein
MSISPLNTISTPEAGGSPPDGLTAGFPSKPDLSAPKRLPVFCYLLIQSASFAGRLTALGSARRMISRPSRACIVP